MIRAAFATLFLAIAVTGLPAGSRPAAEETPAFGLPVDCRVGETCFIQNYVDEDPGPGWRDHACGRLSYDGHDGTDFRLPDYKAMDKGVAVLAAAAGTVLRVRDGMEDVNVNVIGRDTVNKVGGGNAVIIDHGDGWQTAYLHMKRGSVAVTPGQRVEAGQRLGEVGLSGLTEFPHLHFGVRHNGAVVDPFVGRQPFTACGQPVTPLWNAATTKALTYRPTAGLGAGFATRVPEAEPARRGDFAGEALTADSPLLVLWSDIMGVRDGDTQRIRILDGQGRTLFDNSKAIAGDKAVWFAYQGLKRPASGWPRGPYRGIVTLARGGETVVTLERRLEVR